MRHEIPKLEKVSIPIEARLEAADAAAVDMASAAAADLLSAQGDVNRVTERRAAVAEVAEGD